ncbi:RICIN domain-containing protein [Ruminococcus albus]|uniref:Ricin B lectin domain-containing protein n=1 Tax=Ruminococcus albus (strain ATCC 27210 / DSM 20455 / JCM 14654 / NCDO 2250 / 7) TaxID=697329 RepID=E6UGB9_RUMA7|nr:RICIN domain-containing protein [Ruminococcus albus]ADU21957.1 hypothetical protein Rumal_1451 [Ruminococcus albus 7 = DSM 20455]
MNILKKAALSAMAAVMAITGLAATVPSLEVGAEHYGENELTAELEQIAALKKTVLNDYKTGKFTQYTAPSEWSVLCVKFSDVTFNKGTSGERRYTIPHNSDANTVIDHGIQRFEETMEDMSNGQVDFKITTIWVDEPVKVVYNHFGYGEIISQIKQVIPYNSFDSVFFFSSQEGTNGMTYDNLAGNTFGHSYVQPFNIAAEMKAIKNHYTIEQEEKECWTCGIMTHEFFHQVDAAAKEVLGETNFPMCHDYQVNGNRLPDEKVNDPKYGYLVKGETGKYDSLLVNKNKFKYVIGKYPDYLGDYYEAFFRGEIYYQESSTKQVRKGMFPSMWRYLDRTARLNRYNYTIRNVETGNYLKKEDEVDVPGASVLSSVKTTDLFSENVQWKLTANLSAADPAVFQLIPAADTTQLIRAEKGSPYGTAALYRSGWGTAETANKGFGFKLVPTTDSKGNFAYRIQSTLDVFKNCYFRDNGNGSVCIESNTKNNTWDIEKIGIQSGKYYIKNLKTRGALTVSNNAAAITEYSNGNGNVNQEWMIMEDKNGFFNIYSAVANTNLYFDVVDNNALEGNKVQLYGKSTRYADAQLFQFKKNCSGFYTIIFNRNPELCIAWNANKNQMELQKINGSAEQTWDIGQTQKTPSIQSGKYYNIKTADGEYLSWNGSTVTKSASAAKWKITDKGNGYYWIEANTTNSIRFLDVFYSKNEEGTQIRVCTDTTLCADAEGARYAQNWAFVPNADGTLKIMPKLTFARGLKFSGTNAQLSSTPDSFTLVLAK